MKKGQMCEGIVEKVKFPNKGIVKVEDSEVTVKNTIPGQKVSFVINKKRKGKAEGRLLEILEKSELQLFRISTTQRINWRVLRHRHRMIIWNLAITANFVE